MKFSLTKYAFKQWEGLDAKDKARIKDKLSYLINNPELLANQLRMVFNLSPSTHRLRIGSWRLLLMKQDNAYLILKIGQRKNIYL